MILGDFVRELNKIYDEDDEKIQKLLDQLSLDGIFFDDDNIKLINQTVSMLDPPFYDALFAKMSVDHMRQLSSSLYKFFNLMIFTKGSNEARQRVINALDQSVTKEWFVGSEQQKATFFALIQCLGQDSSLTSLLASKLSRVFLAEGINDLEDLGSFLLIHNYEMQEAFIETAKQYVCLDTNSAPKAPVCYQQFARSLILLPPALRDRVISFLTPSKLSRYFLSGISCLEDLGYVLLIANEELQKALLEVVQEPDVYQRRIDSYSQAIIPIYKQNFARSLIYLSQTNRDRLLSLFEMKFCISLLEMSQQQQCFYLSQVLLAYMIPASMTLMLCRSFSERVSITRKNIEIDEYIQFTPNDLEKMKVTNRRQSNQTPGPGFFPTSLGNIPKRKFTFKDDELTEEVTIFCPNIM